MCVINKKHELKYLCDLDDMGKTLSDLNELSYAPGLTSCEKQNVLRHHLSEIVLQDLIAQKGKYAVWATPFTTVSHDRIYCLMERNRDRNPSHPQPFVFDCWCVRGEGQGKILDLNFPTPPEMPKLFTDVRDLILDPSLGAPSFPVEHVLDRLERLSRDRRLIKAIVGDGVPENDPDFYPKSAAFIRSNPLSMSIFKALMQEAMSRSLKWAESDRFLCAPSFYTRTRQISLLLPLCFEGDKVECALVISKNDAGTAYVAQTILTVSQARTHASLLGMVNSRWLIN